MRKNIFETVYSKGNCTPEKTDPNDQHRMYSSKINKLKIKRNILWASRQSNNNNNLQEKEKSGVPGRLSQLSVRLQLRSWSHICEFVPQVRLCADSSEPGDCFRFCLPSLSTLTYWRQCFIPEETGVTYLRYSRKENWSSQTDFQVQRSVLSIRHSQPWRQRCV